MGFSIILIFLISHIVYDFVFQGEKIINLRFPGGIYTKEKLYLTLKGNGYHCLYHLVGTLILFFLLCKTKGQAIPIETTLLVISTHFIIDEIKSLLILKKPYLKESLKLFLFDQLVHVITILIFNSKNISLYIILNEKLYNFPEQLNFIEKILIAILVSLISTFFAAVFMKMFIYNLNCTVYKHLSTKDFYIPTPSDKHSCGAKNGGFIIGVLERFFIILVIALQQPSMIGFVLTAKSIARFKKMEDESFAEYFIIGTFISFIFAVISGLIILELGIIPLLN